MKKKKPHTISIRKRNKIFSLPIIIILLLSSCLGVIHPFTGIVQAIEIHVYSGGSIQDAIDNAAPGDTIIVHNGTYTGSLIIGKQLKLLGEDGPILDGENGNDGLMGVYSNDCVISGFYLVNKYYIQVVGTNNTIAQMTIDNGKIYLYAAHQTNVHNNSVSNTSFYGIHVEHSTFNVIENNTIFGHNNYGIFLRYNSKNNTIHHNIIYDNFYEGISIWQGCHNNQIRHNIIYHNSGDGNGIQIMGCTDTVISFNTISHNAWHGIDLSECHYTTITNNTIGGYNYDGIHIEESTHNYLTNNTISNNPRYGLYFQTSYNNTIFNNYINNTQNVWDVVINTWNITKTPGNNIVGGSYLGGNYWSDYTGVDIDGDGLGDTPYSITPGNQFDYHPLVQASQQEPPDLIITDIWNGQSTIYYQIRNIGNKTAPSGHYTSLSVDGIQVTHQYCPEPLQPEERYTTFFSNYNWIVSGHNDTIQVCVDYQQDITESNETNNCQNEIWNSDTTPPIITTGPTLDQITNNSAKITWETNEDADSHIWYSRYSGQYDQHLSNEQLSTTHELIISPLLPATTYHYKVSSTDASNNTVQSQEQFFQTLPTPNPTNPTISRFNISRHYLPYELIAEATDDTTVDRVEFSLDGNLIFTDYSDPFLGFINPVLLNMSYETFYETHEVAAVAYDTDDNSDTFFFEYSGVPPVCNEMEHEIRYPIGWNAIFYTDTTTLPQTIINLTYYAREDIGWTILGDTPQGYVIGDDWSEVAEVQLYIDDVLINTTTPSNDQTTIIYPWNATGLPVGNHTLRIVAYDHVGCRKTDEQTITVTKNRPRLRITDHWDSEHNYFDFEFYLYNSGQADATLQNMTISLQGFQSLQQTTPDYRIRPHYNIDERICDTFISFTPPLVLPPGNMTTVEFLALPVLYEGYEHYAYTVKINYTDTIGTLYTEEYTLDDGSSPLHTEAQAAIREADYLLVTNPLNLFHLHPADQVNSLLSSMAELSTLKNGIIGYYTTVFTRYTDYDYTDHLTTGKITQDSRDEYLIGEDEDDKITMYTSSTLQTEFDHDGLNTDDHIATGDVIFTDTGGAWHPWDEILIADGTGSHIGDVTIYQYNQTRNRFNNEGVFVTSYDRYDGFAVGEVNAVNFNQIVVANGDSDENGRTDIYNAFNSTLITSFNSIYRNSDFFTLGDYLGDDKDEIIIGDRSENEIYLYDGDGTELAHFSHEPYDWSYMTTGNLIGNSKEEIIIGDHTNNRIWIYGYDDFTSLDMMPRGSYLRANAIAAGDLLGNGKDELVIAFGGDFKWRIKGEVETIPFIGYTPAGGKEALDNLLNVHGEWAEKLHENWTRDGYLLLVGETEILPSFFVDMKYCHDPGCWAYEYKRIKTTDYRYADTAGEGEPELSMGRIIGNDAVSLKQPIQTSINVEKGTPGFSFDRSDALIVAGDGTNDYWFELSVNEIKRIVDDEFVNIKKLKKRLIEDDGKDMLTVFKENLSDRDLIVYRNHASWIGWSDFLDYVNLGFNNFNGTNPIVIAFACDSGRFLEEYGIAEAFLADNAAVYIGSTDISHTLMNNEAALDLFNRWIDTSNSIGGAFRNLKRHIGWDDYWAYRTDHQRYWIMEYQLYGDPKYGDNPTAMAAVPSPKRLSLSTINVNLPMYNLSEENNIQLARIPGGNLFLVPRAPMVPMYKVTVDYPAGYRILNVSLSEMGGLYETSGIELPETFVYYDSRPLDQSKGTNGQTMDWWPPHRYHWTTQNNPDGTTTLVLTVFPFEYSSKTTHVHYHQNFTFAVDYQQTPCVIETIQTDTQQYHQGDLATTTVYLHNLEQQPTDFIVEAAIHTEHGDHVTGLPLRMLKNMHEWGSVSFKWDTANYQPGRYQWMITLRNLNGTLLDQKIQGFDLGVSSAILTNFTATPTLFTPGDQLQLNLNVTNTGSLPLSGNITIFLKNQTEMLIEKHHHNITQINPLQTLHITDIIDTTLLQAGTYTLTAYMLYDGTTTPLLTTFVSTEIQQHNQQPVVYDEYPLNNATNTNRPPQELSFTVEDYDNDLLTIHIQWRNHEDIWTTLQIFQTVQAGSYYFSPPLTNEWIWGDTTYMWSVNVTDGTTWTNKTYQYTTSGSRYDISNDGHVNFQDAGLVWIHRTSEVPYEGLYDVNSDGQVNFQDAGLTWINRD